MAQGSANDPYFTAGSSKSTAVAVSASATTVDNYSGRGAFCGVTVTLSGANPLQITDGPGGPVIFALPANPALGPVGAAGGPIKFYTSLVVVGSGTNPAITVHYNPNL